MELSHLESFINEGLHFATNIAEIWENGTYKDRQRVQQTLFPDGISFDKESGNYRTPTIAPNFVFLNTIKEDLEKRKTGF